MFQRLRTRPLCDLRASCEPARRRSRDPV
jgi:hypothetical protein